MSRATIGTPGPRPHPRRRCQRALIGLGVLDLGADMEGQAAPEADIGDALDQFDGVGGAAPNFFDSS